MLAEKKLNFECPHPDQIVTDQRELTKTWEYREKNLAREALVINPAKACQPLGAVFAAAGFEKTMVELVRQIDLAIHNPIWGQVREPAPWDCPPALEDDLASTKNGTATVNAFNEFAGATAHRFDNR